MAKRTRYLNDNLESTSTEVIPIDKIRDFSLFHEILRDKKCGINCDSGIRLAHLFEKNSGILVTIFDQVYIICKTSSGDDKPFYQKIERLSWPHDRVKEFCHFGNPLCIAALTSGGKLYLLRRHNPTPSNLVGCTADKFKIKNVVKISGFKQLLFVTEPGELFIWSEFVSLNEPDRVSYDLVSKDNDKIVSALEGQDLGLALTAKGKIYTFELYSHNGLQVAVISPAATFVKIVNAKGAFLALSETGVVYSMKNAKVGTWNDLKPLPWADRSAVMDMECDVISGSIFVKGNNSKIYVINTFNGAWRCNETEFSSIADAFASLSNWTRTQGTMMTRNSDGVGNLKMVAEDISSAFNDEATSDVIFVMDGRKIHAHRAILTLRCNYFKNMFSGDWNEALVKKIELVDVSYKAFHAFVFYCYTDRICIPATDWEDFVELIKLADRYCEFDLRTKFENILATGITTQSVLPLVRYAVDSSNQIFEKECIQFILNNRTKMAEIIAMPDNIEILGLDAHNRILLAMLKSGSS